MCIVGTKLSCTYMVTIIFAIIILTVVRDKRLKTLPKLHSGRPTPLLTRHW